MDLSSECTRKWAKSHLLAPFNVHFRRIFTKLVNNDLCGEVGPTQPIHQRELEKDLIYVTKITISYDFYVQSQTPSHN
jgi:hypothetical protein